MMGYGVVPVRVSSSSSSNLSASAPPFTVESSISKPKLNPLVSINESSYISSNPNSFNHDPKLDSFVAAPYLTPANNTKYFSGSFPLYSNHSSNHPQFHSSNTDSVSPTTDAFNYQYLFDKINDPVDSIQYRSHYVGHVGKDEAPLVSLTETNDGFLPNTFRDGLSLHSFGLEYTHQGRDFWNGEGNLEQALQVHDDVAAPSYIHKDYRIGDYAISSKLDVSHKKDVGSMSRESQIQFPGLEANNSNKIATLSEQSYRSIFGESSGMSSTFERSRTTVPKIGGLVSSGYNNAFVPPTTTYEKEQQVIQDMDSLKGYTTNKHSFYTKKDDNIFDTSSFARSEDMSSKVVDNDYIQHKIPSINVSKGYNSVLGNMTVVTENPSDSYIPAVDSPCWKGASASRISSSEECEVTNPNHLKKNFDFFGLQEKGTDNNLSVEDNGGNRNEYVEQILVENKKIRKNSPEMDRRENKPISDLTNEPNLKDLTAESFDFLSTNSASEDASCLPAKEVAENTEKIHSTKSSPKMTTQVLVNSICNLSETLLFQASTDPKTISEKDCEDIRLMISNLEEFLLKKTGRVAVREQEPVLPVEQCTQDHLKDTAMGRYDNFGSREVNLVSGKDVDKSLPGGGDVDSLKDESMICGLKEVLSKNFKIEDELHPQTVLYKNLWLEAESAICAMNVKARFNRMKLEMEKLKSNSFDLAENSKIVEEEETATSTVTATNQDVAVKVSPEPSPVLDKSTNVSSPIPCKNDVEASVMARFQILKTRGETNISNLENNVEEEDVKSKKVCDNDEMMKKTIDQQWRSLYKNKVLYHQGKSDNSSSSDWEHVLKDEFE
ncbi:uncharacterized protein LOC124942159 [Impatiens glandulifera]|uniref:uncharacterized protein LOC124942159 n=1 Tax=Impatiens glandulifera TaxID=253017 RepID=UPI001FB070B7|nr:uncharacterized protein LOC124942159 [Impatiens glandulifera]